jgi:type II secretory pathway component HofQ
VRVDPAKPKKPSPKKSGEPPAWVRDFEKKLSVKITVDFKDAPFSEVLSFLQQAADVGMTVDPGVKVDGAKKITIKAREAELRTVFDTVLKIAGLQRSYRERKIFITARSAKKPLVAAANRAPAAATPAAPKAKTPKPARRGDAQPVEFVETPARQVISYVAGKAKLNVVVDPKCGKLLETPVTFKTKGMKLKQILDWALLLSRTQRRTVDGVIYITPKAPGKKTDLKKLLEKAEQADKDGLLRKPPDFGPAPEVRLPGGK